ncbi:MAG: response regulator transcription factor [Solirubrobacterales bacterium]|nr:response regulator transcription factor [Solirubrobacterales bacterium]
MAGGRAAGAASSCAVFGIILSQMAPVRVFLCDDSSSFRLLVREMLHDGGEIEIVGEAATIAEAQAGLPLAAAHVVLLDLLDRVSEDDLVAQLRCAASGARFVVYSGMPERRGATADAHVHKSAEFDELRRVIVEVAAGS